jgi:hypothetical protein
VPLARVPPASVPQSVVPSIRSSDRKDEISTHVVTRTLDTGH